jgi:cellulose synthase/poly-beta-1,6-N-acetylglucosamine synthase-like glycosyltransferase
LVLDILVLVILVLVILVLVILVLVILVLFIPVFVILVLFIPVFVILVLSTSSFECLSQSFCGLVILVDVSIILVTLFLVIIILVIYTGTCNFCHFRLQTSQQTSWPKNQQTGYSISHIQSTNHAGIHSDNQAACKTNKKKPTDLLAKQTTNHSSSRPTSIQLAVGQPAKHGTNQSAT